MQTETVIRALRTCVSRLNATPETIRVLVVDDDENVRDFVERILRAAGHHTVSAASGDEALAAALKAEGGFDVIVTDVRMPHVSGPRFIEQLRRTERDVKVLYLTGYNDQLFQEKMTLWEGEAFLDKPCTVTGLLEAVSLLVSGRLPSGGCA